MLPTETKSVIGRSASRCQISAGASIMAPTCNRLGEGRPRRRADAYLKGGYGALVGFELQGGLEAGRRFIDSLQMFYHVANIGDARSLAIHPATTTHSQLSPEEQLQTGVNESYIRLSIGIEHEEDILADLSQALDAA